MEIAHQISFENYNIHLSNVLIHQLFLLNRYIFYYYIINAVVFNFPTFFRFIKIPLVLGESIKSERYNRANSILKFRFINFKFNPEENGKNSNFEIKLPEKSRDSRERILVGCSGASYHSSRTARTFSTDNRTEERRKERPGVDISGRWFCPRWLVLGKLEKIIEFWSEATCTVTLMGFDFERQENWGKSFATVPIYSSFSDLLSFIKYGPFITITANLASRFGKSRSIHEKFTVSEANDKKENIIVEVNCYTCWELWILVAEINI